MNIESDNFAITRILIVGLGSIGKRHLKIVRDFHKNAEIYIFRRYENPNVPELANGIFVDINEAISFNPQIVILANPAPFHLEIATIMAKLGCHVLVEKPLSSEFASAQEFIKTIEITNVICQVGYNLRFLPSLVEFKKNILSYAIGDVISVRSEVGQHLSTWRPGIDYKTSVSARSELGGGVLLELSHEIDYLYWIFGEIEWVSSWIGKLSNLEIDVEDTAMLLFGFKSPNAKSPIIASLNMDFLRRDSVRTCTVIGSEGTLRWDGVKGKVDLFTKDSGKWVEIFNQPYSSDESYQAQWRFFIDRIKVKDISLESIKDGVNVLKIINAAKKSSLNQNLRQYFNITGSN